MYDEKYIDNFPNSHYLNNLNNLNKTNQQKSLNRLPTLGEILANKTKTPVDLNTFYQFMNDVENKVNYIDFWFDLINHLNLCKHYVKGLRDSIVRHSVQDSNRDSTQSRQKSLSSSVLLDLIINDNLLEDNDSHRLSQFLRGDILVDKLEPRLKNAIQNYQQRYSNSQASAKSSPRINFEPNNYSHSDSNHNSVTSKLIEDFDIGNENTKGSISSFAQLQTATAISMGHIPDYPQPPKRGSSLNPQFLENLIKDATTNSDKSVSFITRDNLKDSSHNLLLKYFVDDSEKNLDLPYEMNTYIIGAIEIEGRDDPDVFKQVKEYVFNRIEQDHLPKFLNFMAIRNINHSNFIRILLGFFLLFIAFWLSFIFIFLDYAKHTRAVIVIPYFIAFYCLISSIYLIDPILCWLGYSESFSKTVSISSIIKIREKFVYRLLLKRSLWVLFLIILFTAALTLIFALVPGHRL